MTKNKLTISLVISSFVWLLLITQAEAKTVLRSGENVSLSEEQMIEGDFYSAANTINVSGEVVEDMVAAAAEITINGSVGNDALLIAGRTDVHGSVGDDLRIISGEVTLAEAVTGDVFVLGGKVNILSTASIGGDLIVYAGQVTVEGLVEGNIVGSVDTFRIDSVVKGDIDVVVSELTLGDKANIAGSVKYVSETPLNQSLNATVGGDLVRSDPVIPVKNFNFKSALVPVLLLLFSVLAWYLVSRKTLGLVVERALIISPRPFLIGLVAILFVPLAATLLIVSMIGSLVGIVILLAYVLIFMLSIIGFPALLGKLLMQLFNKPKENLSLLTLVIGVLASIVLMILPVVGGVVLMIIIIVTFGSIVDLLVRPVLK